MNRIKGIKTIAIIVMILGIIGVGIGVVFVVQGVSTNNMITEKLRAEKITSGIPEELAAKGDVVDTMKEALAASETLAEHLKGIAPSYGDLLAGERYDPTNPAQLTYAQGINLENAFQIAALAFGVSLSLIATGGFMIIIGIAFVLVTFTQLRLS